jgi:steroid delta-isomerase-like uncharacterized protein
MSGEANKAVVERIIAEVWNGGQHAALDELLSPEYYDYGTEPRNREGVEGVLQMMQAAFPGHHTTIEEIIAEGDTVAVCLTLRGIQSGSFRGIPPTGKAIEIGGYRWYKVVDGKIVSHRGLLDLPSLLRQIGASL